MNILLYFLQLTNALGEKYLEDAHPILEDAKQNKCPLLASLLKSYTYWEVMDISALQKTGRKIGKLQGFCLLSFFFFFLLILSVISVLASDFLLPHLVNFFPQNVGYVVPITTWILPGYSYPPRGSPSSGLFGERETVLCQLLSNFFPLYTYFLIPSETSTLLVGKQPHPFMPQKVIESKGYITFCTEGL